MTFKIIFIIFTAVQWFAISGNPLFQGISFHRGFEINFKPLPKEPFAFIKEKWTPFGVFGRKFAIEKRSVDEVVTPNPISRPVAPVFEHVDEIEHIGTGPLLIVPKAPLVYPSKMPPPIPHVPLPIPMPIIVKDYPPFPSKPDMVPPLSTNMVIIQPTKVVNNHLLSPTGLYTDISKVESVKDNMSVEKPDPATGHSVPMETIPTHLDTSEPPVPSPVVSIAPPPVEVTPLSVEVIPSPAEVVTHPPEPISPPVQPILPPSAEVIPPHSETILPPPEPIPPLSSEVVPPHSETILPPPEPIPPPAISVPIPSLPPPPPPVLSETSEPLPPKPVPVKEDKKETSPPLKSDEAPKKEIQLKDTSFIKGSKMALQFGTVFLTLMAQFLDSARASLDLMTNPPPQFKN